MYFLVYVDGIIIAGDNYEKIIEVKKRLNLMTQFHIKDFGELHSFLQINILRNKEEIKLSLPGLSPETVKLKYERMLDSQDIPGSLIS